MFPRIMPRLTWSSDMIGSTVVTCQGLLMNTNLSKKNFLDWVPFIQCVMEFFTQIHLAFFNKLQVGFDYQLLSSLVVNNNHPLFETKHVDWAWCPEWSLGFIPGQDTRGVYCIHFVLRKENSIQHDLVDAEPKQRMRKYVARVGGGLQYHMLFSTFAEDDRN